jgi:hypothetical protein
VLVGVTEGVCVTVAVFVGVIDIDGVMVGVTEGVGVGVLVGQIPNAPITLPPVSNSHTTPPYE